MALTCKDLIGIKAFEHIELVAGVTGLDKLITWPYVKQTENLKGWLNGGELLFVVDENRMQKDAYFIDIINQANELEVSAIVFLCKGENYIEKLPEEALRLGNKYDIPLFEMPSDIRMIDVTKAISSAIFMWNYQNRQAENFLADMIHEDYFSSVQRNKEGIFYGFDLSKSFFIMVLTDKEVADSMKEGDALAMTNRFSIIALKLQKLCEDQGDKFVHTIVCGTEICYFSVEDNDWREKYVSKIDGIVRNYNLQNSCKLLAGVSKLYRELDEMPRAYNEARQALRYCMKNSSGKNICTFEEMGIMQFLISSRDKSALLEYSNSLLSDLYECDKREQAEYVKTLWMYLKNNNNLVKTSQVLYIHRNTLVNRINKIQSITGKDINSVEVKLEYLNAFSILEFYGLLKM